MITTRFIASVRYAHVVQPLVRIRGSATLDVDEGPAQSHADLAGAAVTHGPRSARRLDRGDRRDHRCGAAGKELRKRAVLASMPPFVDADPAFLGRVTEI